MSSSRCRPAPRLHSHGTCMSRTDLGGSLHLFLSGRQLTNCFVRFHTFFAHVDSVCAAVVQADSTLGTVRQLRIESLTVSAFTKIVPFLTSVFGNCSHTTASWRYVWSITSDFSTTLLDEPLLSVQTVHPRQVVIGNAWSLSESCMPRGGGSCSLL